MAITVGHIAAIQIDRNVSDRLALLYKQLPYPGVPLPIVVVSIYAFLLDYDNKSSPFRVLSKEFLGLVHRGRNPTKTFRCDAAYNHQMNQSSSLISRMLRVRFSTKSQWLDDIEEFSLRSDRSSIYSNDYAQKILGMIRSSRLTL